MEGKVLKAFEQYSYADIGDRELHGFLKFPSIDVTLGVLGSLKSKDLIEPKEYPGHGYRISEKGKQALLVERQERSATRKGRFLDIATGAIVALLGDLLIRALL